MTIALFSSFFVCFPLKLLNSQDLTLTEQGSGLSVASVYPVCSQVLSSDDNNDGGSSITKGSQPELVTYSP